jgi:hypothetical protein
MARLGLTIEISIAKFFSYDLIGRKLGRWKFVFISILTSKI